MTLKGESGRMAGAEGATAPETLRLNRTVAEARKLWKAVPCAPAER